MASEDASWGEEGFEGANGDPTQHSEQNIEDTAQDPHAPGDADDDGSDDGGDYDPESVSFDPSNQVPEQAAFAVPEPAPAPSKPKMTGGFIVEASDDEDEEEDEAEEKKDDQAQEQEQGQAQEQQQQAPIPPATEEKAGEPAEAARSASAVPSTTDAVAAQAPPPPPHIPGIDPVQLLEARVNEDPRGDTDAWLELMAEYTRRENYEALRAAYDRCVNVFPQAADVWVEWIELELRMDNFRAVEHLFERCLGLVPSVKLWTVYLDYIRRINDLSNDASGQARRTITQSYEFTIERVGVDKDSGVIWSDYIQFLKTGPGQVGGTGWQDQQKMDQLRKAYHRAINVPTSKVNELWREYDQFEMSLNKMTGRKFIQERSPGYMSAKSANIALDNITRNLRRTKLPRLPPAPGFDGDVEYKEQVEIWKKWIAWEKDDHLVLATDEPKVFKQRVMYCYRQALMALRFCPEIWLDAADWCLKNDVREDDKETATEMLVQGIAANPESVLLAFKHADHIEANYPVKEGDTVEFAKTVRRPLDDVLGTLYALGDKVKEREKLEVSTLKQQAAQEKSEDAAENQYDDEEEGGLPRKSPTELRIEAIQKGYAAETQLLSRTISYVWIAMARAMRRIQGKGNQTEGGLRKVFTDARHKGRLTSDVYVAVALLESVVYKDPVGAKIFERGARLFPNDEVFMIEYLKFLHSKDDTTNARVVFETCVNRLVSKPETLHKAKPLYAYFHKYESQFGELSQISKLEDRIAELFPDDPRLSYFTARYSSDKFDPVAAPVIISKSAQMRPKQLLPTIEQPGSMRSSPQPAAYESPRPHYVQVAPSPKRPLGPDDEELNPPKRLARGVSPLKGAAGRRLDQQRRNQASALHRDITFILSILPPAHTYDGAPLNAAGLTSILRETPLPPVSEWISKMGPQARQQTPGHGRQTSGEYASRPLSPFGRVQSASGGYRNSPLAAGATYPPPPNAGALPPGALPPGWPAPPTGYGQPQPPQYGGYPY
ncbi:mRNA 3'-end-processing protein-like protein [Emericellopsis cladophorae]|uniref:mRNA 3'-end-processing protein RNA14 n=1 Tax=Emericellopsis cladophorae TaxID=2686198 RepID=A0A9P9XUC2_9HYPO|nr:mRNA 3'-end-processing protein-like protein [Emericellopsis cladophorae]KAI6777943.1 mRNA 3'-end-processing protein-like protein [Emericellopsis cladophorae]